MKPSQVQYIYVNKYKLDARFLMNDDLIKFHAIQQKVKNLSHPIICRRCEYLVRFSC